MTPSHLPPDPVDDDGPALVRPYALVGGRTGADPSGATLPIEAVVVTDLEVDLSEVFLERGAIARVCRKPRSVAEVAALLELPIGVIRVLVGDLERDGVVQVNLPLDRQEDGAMDRVLLERVLAGLEAL